MHYNYFWDYNPNTGRYIQSGPIGLAGGLNTYNYAGSNAVGFADKWGLFRVWVDIICLSGHSSLRSVNDYTQSHRDDAINIWSANQNDIEEWYTIRIQNCLRISCPEPRAKCFKETNEKYHRDSKANNEWLTQRLLEIGMLPFDLTGISCPWEGTRPKPKPTGKKPPGGSNLR